MLRTTKIKELYLERTDSSLLRYKGTNEPWLFLMSQQAFFANKL